MRVALEELIARRLDDVRLAALMLDGIELKARRNIVALGITTEGVKIPLGLWDGSTENATVATALLQRPGRAWTLDPEQGTLFVIDGSKALPKAIRDVFGQNTPPQRCIRHKERNMLEQLPQRGRPPLKRRLRQAWANPDHKRALDQLHALAAKLENSHPGAAGSLHEGLEANNNSAAPSATATPTKLLVAIEHRPHQPTVPTPNNEPAIVLTARPSHRDRHHQNPRPPRHPPAGARSGVSLLGRGRQTAPGL